MAWFQMFGQKAKVIGSSKLRLGRYSDAYKSSDQLNAWERAIHHFAAGQFLKSFQHLLFFLHDPLEQNLHWITDREGNFSFELLQGSRRICGQLSKTECSAVTSIGQGVDFPMRMLEELLEANLELNHCRYGIEDQRILLQFCFPSAEADPFKLYAALKELAIESDHRDDILINSFPELQSIRELHIRQKEETEINVRITWFTAQMRALLQAYKDNLASHQLYPGGFSYKVLAVLYKVEFLLTPQAIIRKSIGDIHNDYMQLRTGTSSPYMYQWMATLSSLLALTEEQLRAEFYEVTTTFGEVESISVKRLQDMMRGQLAEMDKWKQVGQEDYALAIPGFVMGYCLYRYAIPGFWRELFALYFLITEPDFAEGLKYPVLKSVKNGYEKSSIVLSLKMLAQEWEDRVGISHFEPEMLEIEDDFSFGKSWLMMIVHMKLEQR